MSRIRRTPTGAPYSLPHETPRKISPEKRAKMIAFYESLKQDPAAKAKFKLKMESGQMPVQEIADWTALFEEINQYPAYPAGEASRTIKRLKKAKSLDEITLPDILSLFSWCEDDHYTEPVVEAGAFEVLYHILRLCTEYANKRVETNDKSPIPQLHEYIRETVLYSFADALLNRLNAQKADLAFLVPVVTDLIKQSGNIKIGFPTRTDAMYLAMKVAGELIFCCCYQRNLDIRSPEEIHSHIKLLTDIEIRRIVVAHLVDIDVAPPDTHHMRFVKSSLMYVNRYVLQLVQLGHETAMELMREVGVAEALERLKPRSVQTQQIVFTLKSMAGGVHLNELMNRPESCVFDGEAPKKILRRCDHCHREEDPKAPLKSCSKCKTVRYCNRKCQVADWREGHSKKCIPKIS